MYHKTVQYIHMDILNTNPNYFICQQVNTLGLMGGGLSLVYSAKYPAYEQLYKDWILTHNVAEKELLGTVQIITEDNDIKLLPRSCHIFSQDKGITSLKHLKTSLVYLNNMIPFTETLVFPYNYGAGIAVGNFDINHLLIREVLYHNIIFCYIDSEITELLPDFLINYGILKQQMIDSFVLGE